MERPAEPTKEDTECTEAARPRFRIGRQPRESQPKQAPEQRHGSGRETLESVVIAFVLAFLFRTFEAEAFVIPTGSMAPTLMGRHKETACAECGWVFTVGATEGRNGEPVRGVCPNCSFENDIEKQPAFKGDRILVLKALYDLPDWAPGGLRQPNRWDVVVFKFSEEPQVNYIKRLVGLPDEDLSIHQGNIYTRPRKQNCKNCGRTLTVDSSEDVEVNGQPIRRFACPDCRTTQEVGFEVERKPPHKQKVLRMIVCDNNHQPRAWPAGWPDRWQSEPGDAWQSSDGRAFRFDPQAAASDDWARLTYHHFEKSWDGRRDSGPPPPAPVTDFYAYNDASDSHWVGDLTLSIRAEVMEAAGRLRLELVKAGERFICEFQLQSGECRLLRIAAGTENEQVLARAQNVIYRRGRYSITLANVDDRLTLWVGNKLPFGDGCAYDGLPLGEPQQSTELDTTPASVAVQGAGVLVSDLVLYRDIYYTPAAGGGFAPSRDVSFRLGPDEFLMLGDNSPRSKDGRLWKEGCQRWVYELALERNLNALLAEGAPGRDRWSELRSDLQDRLKRSEDLGPLYDRLVADVASSGGPLPWPIEQLEQDVRYQPGGDLVEAAPHVVRRQLLIGKAFFIYWPHGVPFGPAQFDLPLGRLGTFRVPFYPNVGRMKFIE